MENAKTLILNNKSDKNFKAILNLKINEPCLIKFYNLTENSKNYALGIKQNKDVIKVPLKLNNNNCQFELPRTINFNENFFCAVVDVTNIFCPEIVLTGSVNDCFQNSKIESAFVSTKPEDSSSLYENLEEEQIENLIDKNLEEDLNSIYYDSCSNCKYRKAFYDEGSSCSDNINFVCGCNKKQENKEDFQNKNEDKSSVLNYNKSQKNIKNDNENNPIDNNILETAEIYDKNKTSLTGEISSFYEQIKTQIDALFAKYPKEELLETIIQKSKWVKINFNQNEEFYVLGLIYDDTFEKVEYISYGMPSNNSKNPPEDLKDFAQWLPIEFSNKYKGYWIVYQSALTGDTIKVDFI